MSTFKASEFSYIAGATGSSKSKMKSIVNTWLGVNNVDVKSPEFSVALNETFDSIRAHFKSLHKG
jgi:hypothetical protein